MKTQSVLPIVFITLAILCSTTTFAQDALELRQRANKVNDEHLQRVYENNLPNSPNSSAILLTPDYNAIEKANAVQKKKEDARTEQAQLRQSIDESVERRKFATKQEHKKALETLEPEKQRLGNLSYINIDDRDAWFDELFFIIVETNYTMWSNIDYQPAADAVAAFNTVKTTATYEKLTAMVWEARLLPFSSKSMIDDIYQRFPDKKNQIELLELRTLPYFFGANRPNLYNDRSVNYYSDDYYTPAIIEKDSRTGYPTYQLINRFIELADKYPNEGSIAAGFCRPRLNPFVLYARANEKLEKSKLEEYYWRSLTTKVAIPNVDFTVGVGPSLIGNYGILNKRLQYTLEWLDANARKRLKALTAEDWNTIATNLQLNICLIGYQSDYSQLKKACNEQIKANKKRIKEREKLFLKSQKENK